MRKQQNQNEMMKVYNKMRSSVNLELNQQEDGSNTTRALGDVSNYNTFMNQYNVSSFPRHPTPSLHDQYDRTGDISRLDESQVHPFGNSNSEQKI